VADRKEERAARNRDLVAGMGASPTRAQILADFDFEIGDALQLAVAAKDTRHIKRFDFQMIAGG
jgi:hypothetical protein